MKRWLVRYRLEAISFGTGFSLMSFELAAARILAPAIGSSMYVWTSVIGVIIAALSVGFIVGGRVADRRGRASDVAILLLAASTAATLALLSYRDILVWVVESYTDGRMQGVVAALMLFAPTSFLIGVTSPYLAKLNVRSLHSTGRTIAALDACNALGGIIGTFVTGFFLFGFIGARETIICVALLLIAMSWFVAVRTRVGVRVVVTGLLLVLLLMPPSQASAIKRIDSASAHYEIVSMLSSTGQVTGLMTGPSGVQSAVYQDGRDELVFWYTNEMARLTLERQPKSILMLGGGAFTLPQYLAERLPDAQIDVVEIDPKLEMISKEYFDYKSPTNVTLYFEDARTFVNREGAQYDVILVDAYGDTMIPFSLMTREYGEALATHLTPDGMVITNLVVGQRGACRDIWTAINAAYASKLPFIQYRTRSADSPRGNYIVTYARERQVLQNYTEVNSSGLVSYTDNFAPAERLYFDCLRQGA
ncbi:MAG: fused MFS/spermidine synthase [Candidatus Saccharimonas sp.]